ncbi:FecR family protein [Mucilaginibacter pocheonensis]|uniref:Ferric-dicitrate binding protein FerR (Iron transport regulator) n=1 Tax=Mucilaginibacter pocheonensis TaxID=398050 RepID=A0ABU1TDV2_9SPHI|nr:FecR domain-containing protein [Mucilaginibacter pocheonensis]MDR6943499.1 ferric-dicitrate binding protein FerR (iron transport regulator) [Mucilaginibacter pocheonensis]
MGKSRFIELMAKRMGKTATAEELAELEMFFEQFPEYKKVYDVTGALKGNDGQINAARQKDTRKKLETLWYKIKNSSDTPEAFFETNNVRPLFKWQWAAAAVLILGIAGGLFFTGKWRRDNPEVKLVMNNISVPYGTTRTLVMPDGTRVKLNAGSTFSYPSVFAKNTRDVSLNGEGFFEVTHNVKRPFFVHTNKLTVKVLGTVFNVKAYNNDKTVETTLLKGKVQVELKDNPEKNIILLPNEKLMVANNQPQTDAMPLANSKEAKIEYQVTTLPVLKPDGIKETAWLDNRILFTNELFEDVAKQIERKYNVQMVFEDASLKTEQISGLLDKESLQSALQIIEATTPFKYRTEGKIIYLSKK